MVRVSIYNEKGGVGKTTLTALMASFLAYSKGKKVCVLDFDYPSYHLLNLRRSELEIRKDPRSPLSSWLEANPSSGDPYDIFSFPPGPGGRYSPLDVFTSISNVFSDDYDYFFYDFPGLFTESDPVSFLAANGYIDFLAIPIDTDTQSRQSALVVADAMSRQGIPLSLFWNRVSLTEAKGDGERFRRGAGPFYEYGFDVMDEKVRDIRKISRDPSEIAFIRSTLCFPERYVAKWSSSFIPFLEALKERIDSSCKAARNE